MRAAFLRQDTDRVRDASNIAAFIGEYVKLKRTAAGRYVGLCPFHQEKTPSFTVNTVRQRYKCFGCGAGGDVFAFIQQIKGIPFAKAKEELAEYVGVPLAHQQLTAAEKREYARRRAAAEPMAPRLAREASDWERGLELFLRRGTETAAQITAALLEYGLEPGTMLQHARSGLPVLEQSTHESLIRAYRETPEMERCHFREAGKADREDAEKITQGIIGLLVAAEQREPKWMGYE